MAPKKSIPSTATPATPATTVPPATTAPPTTIPPIPYGTTQTYATTGSKVTVYEVQFPPKITKTLPIAPQTGMALAVADAQVCAGERGTEARNGYFQIKTADNRLYPIWAVPQSAADPGFPITQQLPPNDCIRGWVSFEVPEGATVAAIYYSPDSNGRNFLIWKGET